VIYLQTKERILASLSTDIARYEFGDGVNYLTLPHMVQDLEVELVCASIAPREAKLEYLTK
jgi:hypothetical protein